MKKQLLLLVMMLLPMVASADAVEINGIYYNLIPNNNIAEVAENPNKYSGIIIIPSSIEYEGESYTVKSIGKNAFFKCSGLKSVTIPYGVTSIGVYAFSGCTGLKSFIIPQSVTEIGDAAFSQCSEMVYVEIPNSVQMIGRVAFEDCSSLTSLTIPNSVISIGGGAFAACKSLTSVIIPNSVTEIGDEIFRFCSGLISVTLPDNMTAIGDKFFSECTSLVSISIPNSVRRIDYGAFDKCCALTSLTIPNSVKVIANDAFNDCSKLSSVNIGNGVKTIMEYAFANCTELKDLYCFAEEIPNTKNNAFSGSYIEYVTLHVPDELLPNYKATAPWSQFGKIVGLSGGGQTQKCATPTISYGGKKLTFSCETEGVEYVYEIKDSDIKKGYDSEVSLTATYEISVYATKQGYENSDVATATLVWGSACFTETTGTTSAIPLTYDGPMLIKSQGGMLTVEGLDDGQQVNVYGINGTEAGSAVSSNGQATVNTNLQPGSVAIVKIGTKSVKVVIK